MNRANSQGLMTLDDIRKTPSISILRDQLGCWNPSSSVVVFVYAICPDYVSDTSRIRLQWPIFEPDNIEHFISMLYGLYGEWRPMGPILGLIKWLNLYIYMSYKWQMRRKMNIDKNVIFCRKTFLTFQMTWTN